MLRMGDMLVFDIASSPSTLLGQPIATPPLGLPP
jgi:hypothetical protein